MEEERVIEPSEIIVEGNRQPRDNPSHVNPWMRFLARFFDYSLLLLILSVLRKFFHTQPPFGPFENFIPFEYFVWIPFEALLLATWGTTPGKYLLKTKLKHLGRKPKLSFTEALRRSVSVWFRGLGMGIPFLNVFCLFTAYQKLKIFKTTSWDRDARTTMTHYPIAKWRLIFTCAVIIGSMFYYYSE